MREKIKYENDRGDSEVFVAEFMDNTFQMAYLDKNGIAEICLMYKMVCHGNVSPSDMKIIMYEFVKKGKSKILSECGEKKGIN